MRKPPTGEPCAGEPHARFGGRGGVTLPDPYHHLHIQSLGKFVIFYDITSFQRRCFLQIISIYRYLGDIWFSVRDICKILFGPSPQYVVYPQI